MTYLTQSLADEPRGLPNSDANYALAVDILRERYDDASKQTQTLLHKFNSLAAPKHDAKDLRSFLNEHRKVKEQMKGVINFDASELITRSILIRKWLSQTYETVSNFCRNHDFNVDKIEQALKCMIDKSERAVLVTGEKTAVKAVEAKSQKQNSKSNNQFKCPYCSGTHKATEGNKYKTSNARRD